MDEFAWLLKWAPEAGSVSAVIAVVILFLKYGRLLIQDHKEIVATLMGQLAESRTMFKEELSSITHTLADKQDKLQEEIHGLALAVVKANAEAVSAINGMRDEISDLEQRIKQ